LGNAEKLDAEYQANEIKITDAQNKLNENKNGETKMTKKYIETKNSISDFMTCFKRQQTTKQKLQINGMQNLAENGLEIKDESLVLPTRLLQQSKQH
jgi:thymidylate synthase